jgi:hypothetical protein
LIGIEGMDYEVVGGRQISGSEFEAAPVSAETTNDKTFDPEQFINVTIDLMKAHKQRLQGITANIKKSNIIPESDKNEYNYLIDAFRNLDIDGVQRIDKILGNFKELISYPRSLTYYISKLDNKGRKIIDQLDNDKSKMNYISHSEMYYSFWNLYKTMQKVLKDLSDFLGDKDPENMPNLTHMEKQSFNDAQISIKNSLAEIDGILSSCRLFEQHLSRTDNF